jgi:hypothetical protein
MRELQVIWSGHMEFTDHILVGEFRCLRFIHRFRQLYELLHYHSSV